MLGSVNAQVKEAEKSAVLMEVAVYLEGHSKSRQTLLQGAKGPTAKDLGTGFQAEGAVCAKAVRE